MAYIKEYWNNKEQRARHAKEHTEDMRNKYNSDIQYSIKNTTIYNEHSFDNEQEKIVPQIIIDAVDSVSAIFEYKEGRTAVLNFSSYKNPGGLFLNGSKAQEECLCHESFLYNVLKEFQNDFYDKNKMALKKALYLNRALYTKEVFFTKGKSETTCDVITCAAPNKSAAQTYCNVTDEENAEVLISRIHYILNIAKENNVDTLILGAYGCGVFGQDPVEVARVFLYELDKYDCFSKIVFAIPKGKNSNYSDFKKAIEDKKEKMS